MNVRTKEDIIKQACNDANGKDSEYGRQDQEAYSFPTKYECVEDIGQISSVKRGLLYENGFLAIFPGSNDRQSPP